MRALSVIPGTASSLELGDMPEPPASDGDVVAETLLIGVCGTDIDIIEGRYGTPPKNSQRLIIGHESLARVVSAPSASRFHEGDLIAGIVRRPDPVPCPHCAIGEWDMCINGRYVERGIKGRHGYGSAQFRVERNFAVGVPPALGDLGVLLEPASVVCKAWDHAERIGRRSKAWNPRTVLVTGAGPIGLLAALFGRVRGLTVHVFDRATSGPKPAIAGALGAHFHGGSLPLLGDIAPDVIMECTGATTVIADVLTRSAPSGIVCLAGMSSGAHRIDLDLGAFDREMVLENDVVFGSVNANRSHYEEAARVLAGADRDWLRSLITRRVPLTRWRDAFSKRDDDVKVVIDFLAA